MWTGSVEFKNAILLCFCDYVTNYADSINTSLPHTCQRKRRHFPLIDFKMGHIKEKGG
jgi:hypothetical protein